MPDDEMEWAVASNPITVRAIGSNKKLTVYFIHVTPSDFIHFHFTYESALSKFTLAVLDDIIPRAQSSI